MGSQVMLVGSSQPFISPLYHHLPLLTITLGTLSARCKHYVYVKLHIIYIINIHIILLFILLNIIL